jgi:hypothetical protein
MTVNHKTLTNMRVLEAQSVCDHVGHEVSTATDFSV